MRIPIFILFQVCFFASFAQTNILCTNGEAEKVMQGNYNPLSYMPSKSISHPDSIMQVMLKEINPDSLHATLEKLATFYTRHSASDTLSNLTGIGAARRWAFQRFQQIGAANSNRLIPSYLQFDNAAMCGVVQHRNIFGVLPGSDISDKSVVIVEAHIDSRCNDVCDTACMAEGMEDNGSGTALVLEMARVMSKCVFKRTIVFLLVIGEEQGLYGAEAFALYAGQKSIKIHAVLNNDVTGGVLCGNTSSPPSCPGFGDVDSTHVRLFSSGAINSPHKQFARFVKLEYKELVLPTAKVPMDIVIMNAEDRTGRGGDHIPFRQHFFTAIRLTSSNENGSANTADTTYNDRQHTSADVLGLDTKPPAGLDSFFVDFNYLGRNTIINATGVGMAATGPLIPDLTAENIYGTTVVVNITAQKQYKQYRIGVRSITNDWDTVYTFSNKLSDTIEVINAGRNMFSVASVDDNGTESLFSREVIINKVGVADNNMAQQGIEMIANKPNPADEQTTISIIADREVSDASLSITDINGKLVQWIPVELVSGTNEILYNHGFHANGIFFCTLYVEGKSISTVKMVFAN
jgi:hypothetical protein